MSVKCSPPKGEAYWTAAASRESFAKLPRQTRNCCNDFAKFMRISTAC